MNSIDFTQIDIQHLITHHVGNKLRDENYRLSKEESVIADDTKELLFKHFLLPIKAEELFAFQHPIKLELNEIYSVVAEIFSYPKSFIDKSHSISKLLYEYSMHPKIKGGELNIAFFSNIILDNEKVEAIGIFKSETDVPFIKMINEKSKFSIKHEYGFEIKGLDKGCIIFNKENQHGYRILIADNTNKSVEAQYWKDDFLKVKPVSNEFHQTNQFLGITKNFITKEFSQEFDVTKADQIDLLNRSVEYFKSNDNFNKQEFENEVFKDAAIIESFQNFNKVYRQEEDIVLSDNFEISSHAVKKQARVFKSVLKLDKNFHIYIHGKRELIERGVEKDGRKYYKIYYEKES
jgi:hypothetical protein